MTPLGRILVLGLGRSGAAAARYATSLLGSGEVSSVTVYDAADADPLRVIAEDLMSLGAHVLLGTSEVEGEYDLCIASPGIPPHAALMRSAMSASRRTISEIEFAFERSTQPWIAVTGTNGKTTTTALIAHLLDAADIPAAAVGNIGPPAIAQVESGEPVALVAEVSSFQLALTEKFHPKVAVLLNVTPDHVDWHGTLEAYAAAKARVFENLSSDDFAVIDVDDAGFLWRTGMINYHVASGYRWTDRTSYYNNVGFWIADFGTYAGSIAINDARQCAGYGDFFDGTYVVAAFETGVLGRSWARATCTAASRSESHTRHPRRICRR